MAMALTNCKKFPEDMIVGYCWCFFFLLVKPSCCFSSTQFLLSHHLAWWNPVGKNMLKKNVGSSMPSVSWFIPLWFILLVDDSFVFSWKASKEEKMMHSIFLNEVHPVINYPQLVLTKLDMICRTPLKLGQWVTLKPLKKCLVFQGRMSIPDSGRWSRFWE